MTFLVVLALTAAHAAANEGYEHLSLMQTRATALSQMQENMTRGTSSGPSMSCPLGHWDFTTMSNGDVAAIKKGPTTGSGMTELHILSAASNYETWSLQTGTGLHMTGANWAFAMKTNGDLVGIKKGPTTDSGKTEVHILSASSNYKEFVLQTGTLLAYTDNTWAFTMKANGDLVCIKKGPETGSGMTEVHILSAASNYQSWVLQTATALHYTDGSKAGKDWAFTVKPNDDLICVKKGPTTGSGKTEVHILSAASDYKEWALQTGTALHYTDSNWAFAASKTNGDLVGIAQGPTTGTGFTELHTLSASSDYDSFELQTGTALHYTACTLDDLDDDEKKVEIADEEVNRKECKNWCYSKKHADKDWEGHKCNWFACSSCPEC